MSGHLDSLGLSLSDSMLSQARSGLTFLIREDLYLTDSVSRPHSYDPPKSIRKS